MNIWIIAYIIMGLITGFSLFLAVLNDEKDVSIKDMLTWLLPLFIFSAVWPFVLVVLVIGLVQDSGFSKRLDEWLTKPRFKKSS